MIAVEKSNWRTASTFFSLRLRAKLGEFEKPSMPKRKKFSKFLVDVIFLVLSSFSLVWIYCDILKWVRELKFIFVGWMSRNEFLKGENKSENSLEGLFESLTVIIRRNRFYRSFAKCPSTWNLIGKQENAVHLTKSIFQPSSFFGFSI